LNCKRNNSWNLENSDIANVLPEPVCPYSSIVPLVPFIELSMILEQAS
jgi:hypothetical protein